MQLDATIRRQLLFHPLRPVIVDDQRTWKAYEVLVASWHLAAEIRRQSQAGRIGIMLPTSGLFPVAILAAWALGRTPIPLNYLLSKDDLAFVLADSGCDAVVTVGPMVDFVGGLPAGIREIRMDRMSFRGLPRPRFSSPLREDDLATILYTSGTSGRPKGVMLTAANLDANVRQCREWVGFGARDSVLGVLPQFHSFGLTVLTLLPLAVGGRAIYTAKFVPRRLLELARTHRPTTFVAIPSMYGALAALKSGGPDDLSSLRFAVSGGEPLPRTLSEEIHAKYGVRISEGYGLTETAPVTNWCRPDEFRPGSVGKPLPGIDERIVGPDGKPLPPGTDGEIRIKGPNVMRGYLNRPEETAAVFDAEGYFRTGDMGRFDAEGHLHITGRIKEMLIIAGENVFPREIEGALERHPGVHAAAVIGVVDGSRGEVPVAYVEMREGHAFDETALRSHCRELIAQYKVPREIIRLDALPRNPTGKVLRKELVKMHAARG
jgi:long-chain acyl-CoA synthetase